MAWALVTPSSRGIGAALTRHLLTTTPPSVPIVATARSDIPGMKESLLSQLQLSSEEHHQQASRLDVQQCDLLSESSISDLAGYCEDRYQGKDVDNNKKEKHLRLMFGIPGMLIPEKSPEKIEYESALETLKLNLLSPMMLVKHVSKFLPKKSVKLEGVDGLPDRAVLALMSARVGSISDNRLGGWYSYRASKAGVNQLVKSTDVFIKVKSAGNAVVVGLHPGTVKTGLSEEFWKSTKPEKLFSPEFSAEKLVEVVKGLDWENGRGRCWDWEGKEVPP